MKGTITNQYDINGNDNDNNNSSGCGEAILKFQR